jgi:hypothetical protein
LAQHVRKLSEDTREICRGARRGATALQVPADAKSEELIVVTKPSNVGGAKELWFGACLNETDEWGLA